MDGAEHDLTYIAVYYYLPPRKGTTSLPMTNKE